MHVTGWPRQSFTTMEAQRVLNKIGLVCRVAGTTPEGRLACVHTTGVELAEARVDQSDTDRIAALEAEVATAQEAIAGLAARACALEGAA